MKHKCRRVSTRGIRASQKVLRIQCVYCGVVLTVQGTILSAVGQTWPLVMMSLGNITRPLVSGWAIQSLGERNTAPRGGGPRENTR